MIDIVRVKNKRQLQEFIDLPKKLYQREDNFSGDLDLTIKSKLSKKNPFFMHSEIALFLARDTSALKTLGRIAAINNMAHLSLYKDKTGFFGFFDCNNNDGVAKLLIDQAGKWLQAKGLKQMIGPTNLTTNNSCGILIQGYEFPNQVDMPYNFPYYDRLLQSNGCEKKIDLFAYHLIDKPDLERYSNIMHRASSRLQESGVKIRSITARTFKADIKKLREAYNRCNREQWGFLPLNVEEFHYMAKELKNIMPYNLAILAEKGNNIVGYVIAVPDFNQVLKRIPNGKLWPFGLYKIFRYKNQIDSARVMLIGVDPDLRGSGLDLILYQEITTALYDQNIYQCEPAYVMESNKTMNSLLIKIGGTIRKRYRLYQKPLDYDE